MTPPTEPAALTAGPAWLFCPADRPERYAKAADAADVVILDLEDAVAAGAKAAARQALIDNPLDPARTVVRVNASDSPDHVLDLEALAATEYTHLMLAKTESPEQVAALAPRRVIALVETPRGAVMVREIAADDATAGLMWGAEDLVAGLGGSSSRNADGAYRPVAHHVRSSMLLAAKAYGKLALDAVHLDIKDLDGQRAEALDAVATGFDASVCIHPAQVAEVRAAYRPTEAEIDWSRRVLAAAVGERGVFAFEGAMVDAPVLRHAEAVLRRA
ncbi:HpcH/HpaI aldolase/citrate lyase family protein [Tomitella gaofuii]|uniref:HpcH/HpaI aldolase/citrate lyase family protein n=1 Tax=Tomitella gaofuii TaxID=2760083 RepID=UPI0015FCFE24|nr:CoA ester lyase [Tomitella gaofuii]